MTAAEEYCPARYPLFLTAVRAGLRLGELLALEWGDIQFGDTAGDQNRHILVQHNIVRGKDTSPKGKKPRRVDLSKDLRRVLMELRDEHMLRAVEHDEFDERGQPKTCKLVFPSDSGEPLDSRNLYHRDFLLCLQATNLRPQPSIPCDRRSHRC